MKSEDQDQRHNNPDSHLRLHTTLSRCVSKLKCKKCRKNSAKISIIRVCSDVKNGFAQI